MPLLRAPAPPVAIAAFVALWTAPAPAQTTINLRPSARIADDAQQVRLFDVAEVSGEEPTLADTVVIERLAADNRVGWLKVDIAAVRSALDALPGDINWGKVSIRGGSCTVRFTDAKLATRLDSSRTRESATAATPLPVDLSGPATIKTAIAARLASLYGVSDDRLRLAFDAADESILSTLIGSRQADIAPGGLGTSARLPITITLYDGERVALSHTCQVSAMVYRPVLIASTTIERGRGITEDQVNAVEQWVTPGVKPAASMQQITDSTAQRRIAAGETIDSDDVAPPLACKRGDVVYVHCISGAVVVKVKARALGQARDRELVQLKSDTSDAPFTARMSGRGTAVLVAPGIEPEKANIKKPIRKAASR